MQSDIALQRAAHLIASEALPATPKAAAAELRFPMRVRRAERFDDSSVRARRREIVGEAEGEEGRAMDREASEATDRGAARTACRAGAVQVRDLREGRRCLAQRILGRGGSEPERQAPQDMGSSAIRLFPD